MFFRRIKIILSSIFLLTLTSVLSADPFISGNAGGKTKFTPRSENEKLKLDMSFLAFYSGQINFSPDIWSRAGFSLETQNLISKAPFTKTDSMFQVDEISITFRHKLDSLSNYFSFFMGSFDPVGSDIFLQRQFGINSITSKLSETWLGPNSNLIYAQSGIGICDIIRFKSPIAAGIYAYINHEDSDYYVFNSDFRIGSTRRYLSYDFAGGISAPVATKKYDNIILAVEGVNWHAAGTILLGNNYTTSLFLQSGINKGYFAPTSEKSVIDIKDLYLIVEPRFINTKVKTHLSLFTLPQSTAQNLLFIKGTLGTNLNIFSDTLTTRNTGLDFGANISFSFSDINLLTLYKINGAMESGEYNIIFTPYILSKISEGQINAMLSLNVMGFVLRKPEQAVLFNIAYKTSF